MSHDKKPTSGVPEPVARKRVAPSAEPELSDEALENVAGGCEIGCSASSCGDAFTLERATFKTQLPG